MTSEPGTLEVWGGVECSIARLEKNWRKQLDETGHQYRLCDLDAIAALGIARLRYPVLWEAVSPESPQYCEWNWCDERLNRIQELGIGAIAGLVHHGSGPSYTHLLDENFPQLLADYARRVALRYPWIDHFTPINEPLTTARFSCLYGHWYPHRTNTLDFLRAVFIQCKAIALSMSAIREITPSAQLVQTEDLGKTFSTPLLDYQAEFDNTRRWLTCDLLLGQVNEQHRFWEEFRKAGVSDRDLAFFFDHPCPPDIIGINHYLTSDRFLDECLNRYPEHSWGGNGCHRYADVEAVRIPIPHETLGTAARLREAWERYRRPLVITEVHHGCSRDEQLRWLMEVWNAAKDVRTEEGVDLRAVTVWCFFGTMDWNSLLVRQENHYEPGPFDVRGLHPRPTALAHATEALATKGAYYHPVLDRAGWWKRDIRFYHQPTNRSPVCRLVGSPRQLLITGATGTLGKAFSKICNFRGLDYTLISGGELDVANPASVRAALADCRPWAVISTAGCKWAEREVGDPKTCLRENSDCAAVLATACSNLGIPFITFSSDRVFNGRKGIPYTESDRVNPPDIYGVSTAGAEQLVLKFHEQALIIRTSALFGPWDCCSFVWSALSALSAGQTFKANHDIVSPTYVPDLVHETLNLLIDGATGLWHLANVGEISWFDLAVRVSRLAGYDESIVVLDGRGSAPFNTALKSERGELLPSLESGLNRFLRESEVDWDLDRRILAGE